LFQRRLSMRFRKTHILACTLFLLAMPLAAQANPTHAKNCSLATLNGSYTFFEQATLIGEPAMRMVTNGIIGFDGIGNLSGNSITNVEGWGVSGVGDPFTGTYAVNPDCTYSGELTGPDGTTFHFVGTITGSGMLQETHYVITDAGWVAPGTVKRIQPEPCSVSTLKGSYSLFGEGTITAYTPPAPIAHVGIVTYDGRGKFVGNDTIMLNGTMVQDTFTGTYTVSADCTLFVEITSTAVGVVHESGRITGKGENREVHLIVTDPGFLFLETTKKEQVWSSSGH
jgi:hypothetical protein